MTDATRRTLVAQLQALANPIRLAVVGELLAGPSTVGATGEGVGQSLGTTSHHLKVLRRARLVAGEKRGRFIAYALVPRVAAGGVLTLAGGWKVTLGGATSQVLNARTSAARSGGR